MAVTGHEAGGVAWLFPGQGSQVAGMGRDLAGKFNEVAELYKKANIISGRSISDLCFEGPAETLQLTQNAQPALVVTEIAHLTALRMLYPDQYSTASYVAGHSLGEFSALVAAGILTFEDAVMLVSERGRLMSEARAEGGEPSGMMAVLGLELADVRRVCLESAVDLANLNAPGQFVISGTLSSLEVAAASLKALGARRVVPLSVSAAFHSRWMKPMSVDFVKILSQVTFHDPVVPVIANVTARPVRSGEEARALLGSQTYSSVRWIETIEYISARGVTTFVEIGPGKVLSGLVKRISPESQVISSEELLA